MKKPPIIIFFFLCFVFSGLSGYCETPFESGMREFKEESYEEALTDFLKARQGEPSSSTVAFYVGLTYKILENYKEAVPYLKDAVTLTPHVREAVVELVDAMYQTDDLKGAAQYVEIGEKEGIQPARIQFLKGLILVKEGRYPEAITAFNKAKELDQTLSQAVEFQIGNAYIKEGKLKEARNRFAATTLLNPDSDIAIFARDYENILSEKIERERPWRFSIGMGYKYDTNLVAKPGGGPVADQISGQKDFGMNLSVRMGYTAPFSFTTPYSLSLQYSLYAERYFRRDDYNTATNILSATPGYNFSRFSLSLPVSYGYSNLQGDARFPTGKGNDFLNDPANWFVDTKYKQYVSVTPTVKFLVTATSVAELAVGYVKKTYFDNPVHPAPLTPAEDRSGKQWNGTLGWTYFFKEGRGLWSTRYMYISEDTDGDNWSYRENRFSSSLLYPLSKPLRLQLSGDAAFAEYVHVNSFFDMQRKDEIYNGSIGFLYEIFKNTDIITQYSYIRNKSNISTYDYTREVFMVGIEYRY
jgi:tetratricopeptide (TPR) repeat protein